MKSPQRFVLLSLLVALVSILTPLFYIRHAEAQRKSPTRKAPVSNEQSAPAPDDAQANAISDSAQRQIESLIREKQSRTPAQRKISSQLLYATKQMRGIPISDAVITLDLKVKVDENGRTLVDIRAKVTKSVLSVIRQSGGTVVSYYKQYDSVRADVPLEALETIAALPDVRFIRPAEEPYLHKMPAPAKANGAQPSNLALETGVVRSANPIQPRALPFGFAERAAVVRERLSNALLTKKGGVAAVDDEFITNVGAANSQGDTTHQAAQARNFYGLNGKGIKIGIISDSFNSGGGYNSDIASGDLPGAGNPNGFTTPVTVLQDAAGTDEGRAMAQIVHDVVPGAQLYFATAVGGMATFASNITALSNAGCHIIVDDVSYFGESPFQNDAIGNSVDAVVAAGKLYFSSVGNSGNLNDGTSGTWEGDYVDSGTLTVGTAGTLQHVHDFDTTAAVAKFNTITAGSGDPIVLYWSDPLAASNNDYDLYILNSAGTNLVDASTDIQTGTQDPFEGTIGGNSTNNRIVIDKFSGVARYLHVETSGGIINFKTSGQARGHAATSNGYAVAATPAVGPFPAAFSAANQVENFSSDGLRRVFYNPNGTAITPGNVSATGGLVKQKPEITAADGVSTTVPGFSSFFGTSAAAPHAAAIAGLVKASSASLTQTQILGALTSTAIGIEAAGVDRDSGFGIVMPVPALQSLSAAPGATIALGTPTLTLTSGCDAVANGGERGTLNIQLSNLGGAGATGINATLASTTPGVVITQSASAYPDISASGTANNAKPFTFKLPNGFLCGTAIKFALTVTFIGGQASPALFPLTVQTGTTTGSATTTNYSGPTVAIPDTNPGTVNIPLTVSGFTGSVGDLNFRIGGSACNATTGATTNGINHSWVGDIVLTLVSPQGTSVNMISRAGGVNNSGNNFCNTVLDDSAANSIQTVTVGQNPYTGTFKPANPLSVFNGENPNGTWTLTVTDAESPDAGNVTAFGLDITPFTCAAVPATTISGRIADGSNNGLNLVSVKLTGTETQTTMTNANGDYTFNLATCGGLYTVTPSSPSFTFSPPNRTFVNMSGSQTADFTGALGVTPTTLTPGQVLISEFRARGLAGATDEFVEIYNNTDSQITVSPSDSVTAGWTLAALDASGVTATPIYTIPNGTVIPARGHYLVANGDSYTLDAYATGNAYFTGDIPDNTGLALFRNGASTGAPFDAAGFTTPPPGVADTYREGGGTAPVGTDNGHYSFYRKLLTGFPQDTGNNQADFAFVATDGGTYGGRVAMLGAPGPENLTGPIQRNAVIKASLVNPALSLGSSPNRVRSGQILPGVPNAFGTLSIQRRFTNTLGVPVTRLRFRIVDITTLNSTVVSAPQADLRVLTSTGIVKNSAGTTVLTVTGLTLEEPATQISGGGSNSTLTVILPGGFLTSGASIDVQFLLGVQQEGNFRFLVNVEALP